MSSLLIRRVAYHGDNYYFQSPYLDDGIVILEGENGNGKSTFMNLIYFGLGGKVPSFSKDDKKKNSKHTEIFNDTNNYVELEIEINGRKYELTRSFLENTIFIVDENENVTKMDIYRNQKENFIFSDWILNKLGIDVFDIVQGTNQFKIGFTDLMRLVYHDQSSEVEKVYKNPDNDNFLTDSLEIRKAIFEVLMGEIYNEYYNYLGEYKLKQKEYDEGLVIQKGYETFLSEIDNSELRNVEFIKKSLKDKKSVIDRLDNEREFIRNNKSSAEEKFAKIDGEREKINAIYEEKQTIVNLKQKVTDSSNKIISLISNLEQEINEIEKIRFVNKKFTLFSPNTCPYCLQEVDREPGKCICGTNIDEETYEKFFYTEKEYLEILKSRLKTKNSLLELLKIKRERINDLNIDIYNKDESIRYHYKYIQDLTVDIKSQYNSADVRKIDDKIKEIKDEISELERELELSKKRDVIVKKNTKIKIELERLKITVNEKYNEAQRDILKKVELFNSIYNRLMLLSDKSCYNAYITEDYMPCVNSGAYRERSSLVSRRLIYFLTLLIIGIKEKLNYPNFLMLDTPNKEGIDPDNLIILLKQLEKVDEYIGNIKEKYQVILTTGQGVYPDEYEKFVFLKLDDHNKLLKKKEMK